MSATASAIIERREAGGGKPSVTIRQAGDRAVLVEFGEMEFDLTLNFLVQAVDDALRRRPLRGPDRDGARLPLDPRHLRLRLR